AEERDRKAGRRRCVPDRRGVWLAPRSGQHVQVAGSRVGYPRLGNRPAAHRSLHPALQGRSALRGVLQESRIADHHRRQGDAVSEATAGFFARLKQRKLVQWALAYVAFAFALLQGVDVVAHQFGWPDGLQRGITLVLIIGFVVALVLAWYHGERGAQKVSGTEIVILALLLAIGGALLWRFERAPNALAVAAQTRSPDAAQRNPGATPSAIPIAAISAKSIAVLPFENLSGDKDNAYFASGMQDLILT